MVVIFLTVRLFVLIFLEQCVGPLIHTITFKPGVFLASTSKGCLILFAITSYDAAILWLIIISFLQFLVLPPFSLFFEPAHRHIQGNESTESEAHHGIEGPKRHLPFAVEKWCNTCIAVQEATRVTTLDVVLTVSIEGPVRRQVALF